MYAFIVLQVPSSRSRFQQTWFLQISIRKTQFCTSLTVSGGLLAISCAQMYHFFLLCVDVSLTRCLHLLMILSVCLLVQKGPIVQKGSPVSGLGFQSAVWFHLCHKFLQQHYFLINSNSQARAFNTGMQEI